MWNRKTSRTKRLFTIFLALAVILTGQLMWRQRKAVDLDLYSPVTGSAWTTDLHTPTIVIRDPYAHPGTYHKAQLHMHTEKSFDSKWPVEIAVQTYKDAGYTYLAIADHDRVTRFQQLDGPDFVTIPAEENTVPWPFWPLGAHMVRLFVESHHWTGDAQARIDSALAVGGIVDLAHPSWEGNLNTGQWTLAQMLALNGFQLVEVYNPHSNWQADTRRWHELTRRLGRERPIWAIAVDDAHDERLFNRGWIMVKTDGISAAALKEALLRGSLYPSTGPTVDFGVSAGRITAAVTSNDTAEITFIAGNGDIVAQFNAATGSYEPRGHEDFVRVEVKVKGDKRAWSQPFWLGPGEVRWQSRQPKKGLSAEAP